MNPKISVIVSAYKMEVYLEFCLFAFVLTEMETKIENNIYQHRIS